jgi:hypothetical protein
LLLVSLCRLFLLPAKSNLGKNASALAWRAQTVAILGDAHRNSPEVRTYYIDFTRGFVKKYAKLLDGSLSQEDKDRDWLVEIASRFGEFSMDLWSLKANISVEELPVLRSKRFSGHSMELTAARGVGLDDSNNASCDGRPITVVLQPLIFAYRKPAGEKKLEEKKIWAKAVVWVSNRSQY